MVARSATTHRAGLRGDAPASIESVSTTAQSKGQVSSSSSKMRSQQGLKKSSAGSSRKKEHANRIPNHTTTTSKSTKKSHKSMAAASKGTTVKTRPKSVAAKSKATARTGTSSNPSKTRPAKQKRVEEETVQIEEKASTKASSHKPYRPISSDNREDIESTASSEKEPTNASSSRKPSSSIPSKKTAASSCKKTDRSAAPTKKSNTSTKKLSGTANNSRGSEVRSSKPAPTIKSVKSTKSAFSRLSKSTRTKMSRKVPSSSSAKTPGSKSRSSMREHKIESNGHYEEVKEEDEEEEVNDEEIKEEGEDIHRATADARTEAESELKAAEEGEPKSTKRSSRHSSRPVSKNPKHSRSHATSSRHHTTSKNASKSKRSGRGSSSHQETCTYDDSTVSTYQTRPLPVITFSNVECNRMMTDTYEEMGKYAIKPLGLAFVRCACGSHSDTDLVSHQRSYSEPIYKRGKAPASSTVGLNSIHHHPDCPSHHQHDSYADTPPSPTSGGSPRPSATPRSTEEFTEYGPTQYAPTEYAIDDGKTAAISALTMPPLPPNNANGNVDGSAFNLTVHDQDGQKPIPSTEVGSCEQANLDQIALQGIFDQYDEFVANSKVAANNIVSEMQDMSLEKVKQKAESIGNTVSTLFHRAPKTTSRSNLAANKWKDGAGYIHRNQVTIMTPSEEAQDDWESGHVQLRLTESHQHLTESCEPRNPYARLDAVEVIDDSPLKTVLPPVAEEEDKVADESAYYADEIIESASSILA